MPDFRSGFIAILGKPNVGKSTLVNAILGQKIAAVSPRPQTTRRRQLGILTLPDAQLVFVDTPGVHAPKHKLGQFFNQEAAEALDGVDVVLFLVDASLEPDDEDRQAASLLWGCLRFTPGVLRDAADLILGLNKIDKVPAPALELVRAEYQKLVPDAPALAFSAASPPGAERTAGSHHRPPAGPASRVPRRPDHRLVRKGNRGRIDPRSRPGLPAR